MNYKYAIALLTLVAACGDDSSGAFNENYGPNNTGNNTANGGQNPNNTNNNTDTERFLVREVATTEAYVFVPNADVTSSTLARVDANDLSVIPLQVGQNPQDVAAKDIEGIGAVAYALCEGNSTVAIVRADLPSRTGSGLGDVRLFKVPTEVNRLTMSPDGRFALAWIDPERSLSNSPIASLQVMSLIKLGDTPEEDAVYNLSVTRLIRDIEFTDNGELFLLGREGVNRVRLADITADRLVPRLALGLDSAIFPSDTFEMEVDPAARFMVIRSAGAAQVVLYELPTDLNADLVPRALDLPGLSNDIDLIGGTTPRVLVTVPSAGKLAVIDVLDALADPLYVPEIKDVGLPLGLAQITPDGNQVVLYTTVAGVLDVQRLGLNDDSQATWTLRDRVYAMAISPDSKRAIAIHQAGVKKDSSAVDLFQQYDGLTLIDLASGYLRPVVLQGTPTDFVMTASGDQTLLYVLLTSTNSTSRGVMRINLDTFRSDFVSLPKQPNQIGRVGNKIFVSQEASDGRLTFFDVVTNEVRTVSGYELNAVID